MTGATRGAAVAAAAIALFLFAGVDWYFAASAAAAAAAWIAARAAGAPRTAVEAPAVVAALVLAASYAASPVRDAAGLLLLLAWLIVVAGAGRAAAIPMVARTLVAALVACGATALAYVAIVSATDGGGDRLLVYPALRHWGFYPELGMLAVLVLPFPAAVLLRSRQPPMLAASAVIAAVATAGLVLTRSRAAWIAAAAGLLAMLLVRRRRGVVVVVLLAALAAAIGRAAPAVADLAAGRHTDPGVAVSSRVEAWRHAIVLWRERPLLGWGPGAYVTAHRDRFGPSDRPAAASAHSTPLQIGVEAGLAGLLAATWLVLRLLEALGAGVVGRAGGRLTEAWTLGALGAVAGMFVRLQVDYLSPTTTSGRPLLALGIVAALAAGLGAPASATVRR